jgi:hypothetical protein
MKPVHNWHRTPWGRTARFLGSIELAVPVMILVAAALAWGTYLESAVNVKVARATVYGSWWFITLMGLICVSLVFAVITRFPWKRKHVGFMTVHAGLILLIVGGFWSLFGRVEGQLLLEQGNKSNVLTTDTEQVELLRHLNGEFQAVSAAALEHKAVQLPWAGAPAPQQLALGHATLQVVTRWENTRDDAYVVNDAPSPLRAVELSIKGSAERAHGEVDSGRIWIGEETPGAAPAIESGLRIRVMPVGQEWAGAQNQTTGYIFIAGKSEVAMPAEGGEVIPGWKVESVRTFKSAMVGASGLSEVPSAHENPAAEVVIVSTAEPITREQHRAFLNFPDMVMAKTLAGSGTSGLRLIARAPEAPADTLVIHGTPAAPLATFIAADGAAQEFGNPNGQFPWTINAGPGEITIHSHFTNARVASRLIEAPKTGENRPALVVRATTARGQEEIPLLWRQPTPIQISDDQEPLMVRYGPRLETVPFTVTLKEFRKRDYPGTEMAMSYESDVSVALASGATESSTISMNEPFKADGWKVYQSGFIGADVSIFSVMRDPGLPLTYLGCTTLCIGIILTFYVRDLSTGHPGIPALFGAARRNGQKEPVNVPSVPDRDSATAAAPADGARDSTGGDGDGLAEKPGLDPGPGRRTRHAPGHVCTPAGDAADRARELVGR